MIRSGIACVALVACASPASAELAVHELEQQPFQSEIASLFTLEQGDLLLRMRGRPDVVYVLAPDGRVKERAELLSESYAFVVPYRSGFAIQRLAPDYCTPRCRLDGSQPVQIVAYASPTDADPKVLYESPGPFSSSRLYAAPDGQDLYVLVGSQLTRIDSNGQIAWQKELGRLASSSFVATDDGVAFVQYVAPQTPAKVLRALDRAGRLRWETPLWSRVSGESIYSAAGFITLLADVESEQARHKPRLVNFDVRTGQLTADVVVEPFTFATGTKDGLLIGGYLLGQAYVTTLDRKGKYVWLRRYVPDHEVGDIQQGAMTRDGKLVFVTRGRVDPKLTPPTSVVVTDSTAAALGTTRGGCLDPDWEQAAEAAAVLNRRGILVAPPALAEVRKEPGCTDREAQFIAFVKELSTAARGRTVVRSESRRQITARVTAAGEPIRLEDYSVSYGGINGAGTTLSFAAPYDGAAAFWKLISSKVAPHLDRMQELEQRFIQMTGCPYMRDDRSQDSIDAVLTGLEKAARLLNQRIATIAPEELAATGPDPLCGFILRRDGFGTGDGAMFPLAVADRTLLDVVRRHQEAAARGDRY